MNVETPTPIPASETYPSYDALWHLKTLGVISDAGRPNDWSADAVTRPTRVAIIDTSVAAEHPNLLSAVDRTLSLDLFSARLGSFSFAKDGNAAIGDLHELVHAGRQFAAPDT